MFCVVVVPFLLAWGFVGSFGGNLLLNFLILSIRLGSGFCCCFFGSSFFMTVVGLDWGGLVGCCVGWFLFLRPLPGGPRSS